MGEIMEGFVQAAAATGAAGGRDGIAGITGIAGTRRIVHVYYSVWCVFVR